jgi:hypothetical protein
MSRRDYELQRAPEFLFERRPLNHRDAPDTPEHAAFIRKLGDEPKHRLAHREERIISRDEAPNLTVTSDPGNFIVVGAGNGPDWAAFFSAEGRGSTEAEAERHLRQRSLIISGSTVSLGGPNLLNLPGTGSAQLVVEGPGEAGVVIHASYSAVEVRDMAGPVRIAATHARATVLDTTGHVDATAGVVDFAGPSGSVTLSSESEINLKVTARDFNGTLLAWAQSCVRMLVPREFASTFEALVAGHDDFVCRAEFASSVKCKRQGPLYVFTFGVNPEDNVRPRLHLRSEQSTVVIDHFDGHS